MVSLVTFPCVTMDCTYSDCTKSYHLIRFLNGIIGIFWISHRGLGRSDGNTSCDVGVRAIISESEQWEERGLLFMYVFEGLRSNIYITHRITSENRRYVYIFGHGRSRFTSYAVGTSSAMLSADRWSSPPLRKTTSPRNLRPVVVRLCMIC